MSQNNLSILYVGLDVAKLSLELHLAGQSHRLTNDPKGHAKLLKLLRPHPQAHVVCEATGGYEQPVVRVLQAAAIAVSVLEAGRVRYFAKAKGLRAKTDPIDAAVLTQYGQTFTPQPTLAPGPQQRQLLELTTRRRQLVDLKVRETNRAEHYTEGFSTKQSRRLLKLLEQQIDQCDQQISQLIAEDPVLNRKAKRLEAIAGVGPATSSTVLAQMPELGKLSNTAAAALAGVAPYNQDSGKQASPRHIAGGRKTVRCALYMAALSAVRHEPILKDFYLRLRTRGKKPLVALTAVMRKLIVLMNRLLKNDNFLLAS
jgi:transposase